MNQPAVTNQPQAAAAGAVGQTEVRQKALQEELKQLVGVVGPGPLVDLLLERAFQLHATDLHFDPTSDGLRVRLRVDGQLHDVLKLPTDMMQHVQSRIKLMANMDITERRVPQDGHISSAVLQHQRDVRVGSGPTIYGERLVLRLMPDASAYTKLEQLGFDEQQIQQVQGYVNRPYGMILSVGPVGSGKSTTIYACLDVLNDPGRSLVTIEDPVERRIAGINQIQIDTRVEFGFVRALRGVLRQDPDVMMVGEIRDPETAHIACRAGLTGIVVLSTLHANDSASTIDVFREFGVPPMFIADALQGIISQRLLRLVCQHCRQTYHPEEATCQILGVDPNQAGSIDLVRGTGCDRCFHTGYHGRTGVFENLTVDNDIRSAILHEKSQHEIMDLARSKGMISLEEAARKKVLAGITTVEEMHRVLTTVG